MFKWLTSNAQNEAFVQKREMQKANFERVKEIQKLLGQSDKHAASYASIPHKFSSMKGNIYEQLKQFEIEIYCKDTISSIIKQAEESDPITMAKATMDEMLDKVELRLKKSVGPRKRLWHQKKKAGPFRKEASQLEGKICGNVFPFERFFGSWRFPANLQGI